MAEAQKVRIAYVGEALNNGAMEVNDLAPALLAFGNLIQRTNIVIGNERAVRVLLKADDIRRGSFDITLLLDYNLLEEAKLFMGLAEDTGLKDLMDVLGMGITAKESIFWLIKLIGFKKIRKAEKQADHVKIILEDNRVITVTQNVYNVFMDFEARTLIEKVVTPVKKEGIQGFEIRNPDDYSDSKPTVSVDKESVACFAAPALETKVEPDIVYEQDMMLRIVSIVFDEKQKWRFSDGEAVFWAKIEDERFWKEINDGVLAFRKGDKLKVRCRVVQRIGENESLVSERTIINVIKVIPKPTQIKLDFTD